MTRWTETTDAAQQIDDWNNAQRDEVATQRNQDSHLISDDIPHTTTPYCTTCQRGVSGYVCGPCARWGGAA